MAAPDRTERGGSPGGQLPAPGTEHVADPWTWDASLFAGTAPYYASGRLPYPEAVATALRRELDLDGTGRLLDVGCGPGSLTLVLAHLFDHVVGIDADPDMIVHSRRQAWARRCTNATWVVMRAEALPGQLGTFRTITLAQSFHWMDRPLVARTLLGMLGRDGALVHVGATTQRGLLDATGLPGPSPPRERIDALVASFLGPVRRAGQGFLPAGTPGGEDDVLAAAGFEGPVRVSVPGGPPQSRSEDEIVASVFSLSSAAPHLFGERLAAFEADLRSLLREGPPEGRWWEQPEPIGLSIWRPGGGAPDRG